MSGEREAMSSLQIVRYPTGGVEYRMSDDSPEVGDVLTRDGDNWIVEEVTHREDGTTLVTLRPRPKPVKHEDEEAP
jgi:hypothetical protein